MEEQQLWLRASADGLAIGPFSKSQLRQLGRAGLIGPEAAVRQGAEGRWFRAGSVKGLLPEQPAVKPAAAAVMVPERPEGSAKSNERSVAPTVAPRAAAAVSEESVPKRRSTSIKVLVVGILAVGVVAGVATGGYLIFRGGGFSIPFLSPSPTSTCEAASGSIKEYATAMAARNQDAACEALRKFLDKAQVVCAPEFDSRVKSLALADQASVRKSADEIVVIVLALGASPEALSSMDVRIGGMVSKTRSMLNCINPKGLSAREHELVKESGMMELPEDIARRASELASRVISRASAGH